MEGPFFSPFVTTGGKWTDAGNSSGGFTSGSGVSGGVVAWSLAGAGLADQTGAGFYSGSSVSLGNFLNFDFTSVLRSAFDAWAAVGNIEFIQVADNGGNIGVGSYPTIRIVGGFIDGSSNVLARAFFPSSTAAGGDVVFDSGETTFWSSQSFFRVALHEIGHTLGLAHEPNNLAIMNAFYNPNLNGLQQDDINGIRAIYGAQDFGPNVYYMPATLANLTLVDGAPSLTVVGNAMDNVIVGTAAIEAIDGGAGNDTLIGAGNPIAVAIGAAYTPAGAIGANWTIIGTADASNDGKADYLWSQGGQVALWTISGGTLTSAALLNGAIGADWTARTTGDFNADNLADVLWVNNGRVAVWELNGPNIIGGGVSNGQIGTDFQFRATGDFNGDGFSDVLWHNAMGQVAVWSMVHSSIISGGLSNGSLGSNWSVGGTGDVNGDGRDDVVWVSNTGDVATWLMSGQNVIGGAVTGTIGANWRVGGMADMNMDGKSDIVWTNSTNNAVTIWLMNGTQLAGTVTVSNGGQIGLDWTLSGVGDVTGDGRADIIWTRPNGSSVIWDLQGNGDVLTGGSGQDTFWFSSLAETGKVITDFQAGWGGDVLNLHDALASAGYTGSNGLADGWVRMIQDGSSTEIQIDAFHNHWVTAATLQGVVASSLVSGNFIV